MTTLTEEMITSHFSSMWIRSKRTDKNGDIKFSKAKLLDPIIVNSIDDQDFDTSNWCFDIGFHFRSAIGLRYCTRIKTVTLNNIKKKVRRNLFQQTPILSFHEGDTIYHRSDCSLVQVEEGLPSGFDGEFIEHGLIRFSRYVINPISKTPERKDRFVSNQFDFLLMLIFGYSYLERMTPLLVENHQPSIDPILSTEPIAIDTKITPENYELDF